MAVGAAVGVAVGVAVGAAVGVAVAVAVGLGVGVGVGALTTWPPLSVPLLVLKLPSPPYVAVIGCVPALKLEVAKVATPLPFNVPVPRVVEPSLNVTVPVGPLPEVGVTVAVNVTL